MAKRTKAYAEKKAKLANPTFYVSKTRLCVRNLPTSVDEKKLRAIFQHAATSSSSKVVQVERGNELGRRERGREGEKERDLSLWEEEG